MPPADPGDPAGHVTEVLGEWRLVPDGEPWQRAPGGAVVLAVRTDDGLPAVLKLVGSRAAAEREALALQSWQGHGAVRLLQADPYRQALLLERAEGPSLRDHWDVAACEVVGSLYRRLHVPAPRRVRRLAPEVARRTALLSELPRNAPLPRRLVEQAVALGRDLAAGADEAGPTGGRLLHGDLHYDHVLASEREPWLVVAPDPVAGDPHFEVVPLLLHRWDELAGDVRDGVRRRFHAVVDAAELDEGRARDWVVVRALHRAVALLADAPAGRDATTRARLTACVAVAKAVQD